MPAEGSWEISASEGEVPAFLRGTYYLIGPARFARGELRYRHWLDGDGLVTALAFGGPGGGGDGGVRATQRFVRSAKLVDEEAAGRPLYRAFGTAFPGDRLVRGVALASPVNVSVYPFAGNLLAFGEQGLPWRLDPVTLETARRAHLRAAQPGEPVLRPSQLRPGERRDDQLRHLVLGHPAARSTSTASAPTAPCATAGASPSTPPARSTTSASRRATPCSTSTPICSTCAAMIERGATVLEALSWQPERGSRLLVVDLERGEAVASVPIGARYCLHHVNCYEEGDRLIVDVLELEEPVYPDYEVVPDLFTAVAPAHPVRLVVDLARGELAGREELPYRLAADFPSSDPLLNGRPYHRFWMLAISATGRPGRKFLDQLVAVDWRRGGVAGVYQAPPGRYLGGEPIFIGDPAADPAGDDRPGVVIVQEIEPASRRADFLLFDAADVARGPHRPPPPARPHPPLLPRLLVAGLKPAIAATRRHR